MSSLRSIKVKQMYTEIAVLDFLHFSETYFDGFVAWKWTSYW